MDWLHMLLWVIPVALVVLAQFIALSAGISHAMQGTGDLRFVLSLAIVLVALAVAGFIA